jgi:hypothetical protein
MSVLASLSHPSLVTLYDARVVAGETSYLVMELVDGPTLTAWLDGGALKERDAALLGLDLAEALHVVHGAGIVHRDVKPSNVLLSPTDLPGRTYRARLADFGIAYLVDSTRLTHPGTVVGTAAFLAPEQVKGSPPAPPADIYALGLLLLEAMTGERAFAPAAGVESLVTRLHVAPTVPDSLGTEWQELLVSMTAIDPAARPTAIEVVSTISGMVGAPARRSLPEPLAATVAMPDVAASSSAPAATRAAPVDPGTAPTTLLGAGSGPPPTRDRTRPRRKRRRGLVVGASVAAAGVLAGGLWLAGNGLGAPAPAASVTAVTEPSIAPSTPAPAVVPVDAPAPIEAPDPVDAPVEEPVISTDEAETAPQTEVVTPAVGDDTDTRKDEQDAEKAAEQTRKDEEKAAEQAQRDAEKAEEKTARPNE